MVFMKRPLSKCICLRSIHLYDRVPLLFGLGFCRNITENNFTHTEVADPAISTDTRTLKNPNVPFVPLRSNTGLMQTHAGACTKKRGYFQYACGTIRIFIKIGRAHV